MPFAGPGAAEFGLDGAGGWATGGRGVTIEDRPVGTGRSVGILAGSSG
jgi:hypothetical protein